MPSMTHYLISKLVYVIFHKQVGKSHVPFLKISHGKAIEEWTEPLVFDNKLAFQRFKSYTYMAYEGKE